MLVLEAIENIEDVPNRLQEMVDELRRECTIAKRQWSKLGAIGAQREDHAANLLHSIGVHLHAIKTIAATMENQVKEIESNPFGDE